MRHFPKLIIFLSVTFFKVNAQQAPTPIFGDPRYQRIITNNTILFKLAKAYRFPDFVEGIIVLRNREQVVARLNYHIASGQLEYINDKNDTLSLDYPEAISYATINESKFYFFKGKYLQTLETRAGVTLAYNQEINTTFSKSYILYANFNQIHEHTVDIPSLLDSDQQKFDFDGDGFSGTTYITKYYYLGDSSGNFVKANKNNLLKYFEKNAISISQYIDEHAINFNKLSDIRDVLLYSEELMKR